MEEPYTQMYQKRSREKCSFIALIALLVLLIAAGQSNAQYAMVKRITAETNDGIRVSAWRTQSKVTLKQEVRVFYEVLNRSDKAIYLVRKAGELETDVDGDALVIPIPLPFPEGHGGYDYTFTKVERGKRYRGELVIPAGRFNKEQTWLININFGFVTNVVGLNRKLRPNEDPASLRGTLGGRLKLVALNGIVIEVEES